MTAPDISQVDPRRWPRTDILWASPECTNHSQAKGKKRQAETIDMFAEPLPDEAAQRSRATMWDVVRFAEHHRYRAVIVENVVDAYHWLPFQAWLLAMDSIGYTHQIVWLNSMHAQAAGLPAPQSRDRMYVVFWAKDGKRPNLRKWTSPKAWCPSCDKQVTAVQVFKKQDRPAWGRYRTQYVYRCPTARCHQIIEPGWLPAAAAIDWSLPGQRIGDRAKPLAPKTIARIEAGLKRYAMPVHLEHGGNQYDSADPKHPQHGQPGAYMRSWPVTDVVKTLHTAPTKALAYAPLMVPVEGRDGKTASPVTDPARTQSTRNETALLVPAGGTWNESATHTDDVMRTRTTRDTEALVIPLRNNNTVKRAHIEPLDTVAANGNHHSLVQWGDLLVDYRAPARLVNEVMPTQTTIEHNGVASLEVDVDDCLFRMLEPHEIAAAMAFGSDYIVLGNKREQVRLCGNAVTPPAARDLVAAVAEALG